MVEGAGGREAMPMACFSEQAQTLFKDWKQDQLLADLERTTLNLLSGELRLFTTAIQML